jgi:putative FmdB family regulatory protein
MPTYEYLCSACGHRLEVVQRINDDPVTTCAECGGRLRRVFHPVGVVLKGSGFYATDNRSGKSLKTTDKKDGGSSGSESTSSESRSEKSERKSDGDKPKPATKTGSDT